MRQSGDGAGEVAPNGDAPVAGTTKRMSAEVPAAIRSEPARRRCAWASRGRTAATALSGMKDSLDAGPDHSNQSDQNSDKMLLKFTKTPSKFVKIQLQQIAETSDVLDEISRNIVKLRKFFTKSGAKNDKLGKNIY